jgi:hypothetical protein
MVKAKGELSFMLLDFDWAGKDGEVRHPIGLNHVPKSLATYRSNRMGHLSQ